ncbi:SulA-like leucine-rich domain-containing protein [Thorsellia anophelis]|uniref:Cell division inhibitor SulA n=1 Tax=Thorsellia anophelis DSM 18579 TaxID=1123402 RepID=A0A1I0DN17_9GAMM|nr:SulA-like leucine-rich domain-containing protein [Thorsellia anophelis]SET33740.1 Cell division inhibitor SulA [Thorsellia anophelis DSM 18579]
MKSLKNMNVFQNTKLPLHLIQSDQASSEQNKFDTLSINTNNSIIELTNKNEIELLLPSILKALCNQNKFITIIGAPRKLDKNWFKKNNLPLDKFIQINSGLPDVQTMRLTLRALSSGKSSGVISWLSDICKGQFEQLEQAASHGDSKAIILPLIEGHQ